MGLLGKLLGGKTIDKIGGVVDEYVTTKEELMDADLKRIQLQAEINRQEAQHRTIFVAGWRPAIGWICGVGLAWAFVIHPLLTWVLTMWFPEITSPEPLETGPLLTLLTGMLGLGAMRSWEKSKKLTK